MKLKTMTLAALLGCGSAAFADPWVPPNHGPVSFQAMPGVTLEKRNADQARCRDIVHKADSADLPQLDEPARGSAMGAAAGQAGVAGVAGVLIAEAILGAIDDAKAARRGEALCMYNLGYRTVALTPAEIAAYAKLPPAKQKTWERTLLPADADARLAPLLKPDVPRLPAYDADAALVDGSIRIAGLTLAAAEIQEQGVVVKGTATRRRTAVLVTPIETQQGAIRVAADAGTVFHLVDYRMEKEPMLRKDGSTWCGPMRQMADGNVAKDFYCLTARDYGYEIYRPSGHPWLAGPYTNGLILPAYGKPIQMEERAQDDLGTMELELNVVKVESSAVLIAADVKHAGQYTRLWLRRISFDKSGVAVLPLWDSRLVLTRAPNHALKAALSPDGDGSSWRVGEFSANIFPVPVSTKY